MRPFLLPLLSLLLAACGGGGGGEAPAPEIVAPRTGLPGVADASFAQSGMFVFPAASLPNAYSFADSAARLESGKLLVGGAYTDGRVNPFALRTGLLVRLLPNGTLDTTFLRTGYLQLTGSLVDSVVATRLVPVPLERVVWTHFTARLCGPGPCPPDPGDAHVYGRRINLDGFIETTYGFSGTSVGHMRGRDIAAASDGSMVVFGERVLPAGSTPSALREVTAFSHDGVQFPGARMPLPPVGSCPVGDLVVPQIRAARQPDRKAVAMWVRMLSSASEICLVRVDEEGAPDPSFGAGGFAVVHGIAGADIPVAILPRRDGGSAGVFTVLGAGNALVPIIVWFDAAGNLDTSRGVGGVSRNLGSGIAAANAAVLQPDEKILIAGTADATTGVSLPPGVARIARLDARGNLDRSFGPSQEGISALGVPGRTMRPAHLLVASDWSIFVSGTTGAACLPAPAVCDPESMAVLKLIGGER